MSLLRSWIDRIRRHRATLTKFGVIGLCGVVADVGGFNLLRYAGGEGPLYNQPLTAKVISVSLGIMVSWLGNRYWTFHAKRRTEVGREFVMFLVVSLIGLAIALAPLALSHYVLDLRSAIEDNISANVIGLGFATMFRFWAMQKHVFTGGSTPTATAAHIPTQQLRVPATEMVDHR